MGTQVLENYKRCCQMSRVVTYLYIKPPPSNVKKGWGVYIGKRDNCRQRDNKGHTEQGGETMRKLIFIAMASGILDCKNLPGGESLQSLAAAEQPIEQPAMIEEESPIPVVSLFGWTIPLCTQWTWEHLIEPLLRR